MFFIKKNNNNLSTQSFFSFTFLSPYCQFLFQFSKVLFEFQSHQNWISTLRQRKKERNTLYQSFHCVSLAKRCPYLKSIGDFFLSFLAVVHSPVPSADWQQLSNIHSDAASTVIKC